MHAIHILRCMLLNNNNILWLTANSNPYCYSYTTLSLTLSAHHKSSLLRLHLSHFLNTNTLQSFPSTSDTQACCWPSDKGGTWCTASHSTQGWEYGGFALSSRGAYPNATYRYSLGDLTSAHQVAALPRKWPYVLAYHIYIPAVGAGGTGITLTGALLSVWLKLNMD